MLAITHDGLLVSIEYWFFLLDQDFIVLFRDLSNIVTYFGGLSEMAFSSPGSQKGSGATAPVTRMNTGSPSHDFGARLYSKRYESFFRFDRLLC